MKEFYGWWFFSCLISIHLDWTVLIYQYTYNMNIISINTKNIWVEFHTIDNDNFMRLIIKWPKDCVSLCFDRYWGSWDGTIVWITYRTCSLSNAPRLTHLSRRLLTNYIIELFYHSAPSYVNVSYNVVHCHCMYR